MVRVFESRALLWNVGTSTFLQSEVFLWSASGVQEQLCFWSTILSVDKRLQQTDDHSKPKHPSLQVQILFKQQCGSDLYLDPEAKVFTDLCRQSCWWLTGALHPFIQVGGTVTHEGHLPAWSWRVLKILHPQKLHFFSFPKMEKKADVVLPRVLRPWTCSLTACRKGRHGLASLLVIRHFWSSLNLAFLQQNLQPLVLNGCFHSQHYSSVKATVDGRTLESTVFEKPGQNVPVTHTTTSLSKSWATSLCSVLGLWSFTS